MEAEGFFVPDISGLKKFRIKYQNQKKIVPCLDETMPWKGYKRAGQRPICFPVGFLKAKRKICRSQNLGKENSIEGCWFAIYQLHDACHPS